MDETHAGIRRRWVVFPYRRPRGAGSMTGGREEQSNRRQDERYRRPREDPRCVRQSVWISPLRPHALLDDPYLDDVARAEIRVWATTLSEGLFDPRSVLLANRPSRDLPLARLRRRSVTAGGAVQVPSTDVSSATCRSAPAWSEGGSGNERRCVCLRGPPRLRKAPFRGVGSEDGHY